MFWREEPGTEVPRYLKRVLQALRPMASTVERTLVQHR